MDTKKVSTNQICGRKSLACVWYNGNWNFKLDSPANFYAPDVHRHNLHSLKDLPNSLVQWLSPSFILGVLTMFLVQRNRSANGRDSEELSNMTNAINSSVIVFGQICRPLFTEHIFCCASEIESFHELFIRVGCCCENGVIYSCHYFSFFRFFFWWMESRMASSTWQSLQFDNDLYVKRNVRLPFVFRLFFFW